MSGSTTADASPDRAQTQHGIRPALVLGAIGIVFGDIGTSPLYTIIEVFHHGSGSPLSPSRSNVLGVVSIIVWSVIVVVTVKYLMVIMRADNRGEGGILALVSLAMPSSSAAKAAGGFLLTAGLIGAAMLYGDGVITPAISVLSAIEGATLINPSMEALVVPISIGILVALFAVQRFGTTKIGKAFGPIMISWFITIAVLGSANLIAHPAILAALNPIEAIRFFVHNGGRGFLALGAICLSITGGEALYADMGHFGRTPIRHAWLGLILPALLLCYLGQGASLLAHPERYTSPFYLLAPNWALVPLVALATCATVIASQALISGAFSMTAQAINLGFLPRMNIIHTTSGERGQIYVPTVNALLAVGCVGLVLGFRSATALAGAFGLAVTATMALTTYLFFVVATRVLGWSKVTTGALCTLFAVFDLSFLGANIPKIPHGGWFPLTVCACIMVMFTTWNTGRRLLGERIAGRNQPIDEFVASLDSSTIQRTSGMGVYLGANPDVAPQSLVTHLRAARSLPEHVCVLNVITAPIPHVDHADSLTARELSNGFHQIAMSIGYMDQASVASVLEAYGHDHVGHTFDGAQYVLGRETLLVTDRPGMAQWRERLFRLMMRNSLTPDVWFDLPPDRTIEVGTRVEL